MVVKYTKRPLNIPTSSIARPSKIDPNWDICFETVPSGKPDAELVHVVDRDKAEFQFVGDYLGSVYLDKTAFKSDWQFVTDK
jgi:hypothetical protein